MRACHPPLCPLSSCAPQLRCSSARTRPAANQCPHRHWDVQPSGAVSHHVAHSAAASAAASAASRPTGARLTAPDLAGAGGAAMAGIMGAYMPVMLASPMASANSLGFFMVCVGGKGRCAEAVACTSEWPAMWDSVRAVAVGGRPDTDITAIPKTPVQPAPGHGIGDWLQLIQHQAVQRFILAGERHGCTAHYARQVVAGESGAGQASRAVCVSETMPSSQ